MLRCEALPLEFCTQLVRGDPQFTVGPHGLRHHRAAGEHKQNEGPLCNVGVAGGGSSACGQRELF